jgi:hypothetical protein
MPLLKKAAKVTIFAFSSRPSDLRASAERLGGHLEAHGVVSRVSDWTNTSDLTAIEALFATQDADLIVAGASATRGSTRACPAASASTFFASSRCRC